METLLLHTLVNCKDYGCSMILSWIVPWNALKMSRSITTWLILNDFMSFWLAWIHIWMQFVVVSLLPFPFQMFNQFMQLFVLRQTAKRLCLIVSLLWGLPLLLRSILRKESASVPTAMGIIMSWRHVLNSMAIQIGIQKAKLLPIPR